MIMDAVSGSDTKACPIAQGKFNSKKHGFGQVHGLIKKPKQASQYSHFNTPYKKWTEIIVVISVKRCPSQ